MTLIAGELLDGRYRLMERIGVGGTSSVFRAHDEMLGRDVAIKRYTEEVGELADEGRRRSEVRLLAGLTHPGIVTLYDAALDSRPAYLVMELVEGLSLRERLRRGALTARETDEIGAAVAAGLAAIHARGVVHRDVKPDNIVLPDHGSVQAAKLVDFGIARPVTGATVTSAGQIVGTAAYLSPEQARGGVVGPASDVYSLGLVLIEALSGERPFPGDTLESIAARLHDDPDLSSPALAEHRDLLAAMTARDPDERPSAGEVAARLLGMARTRPLGSPDAPTVPLASAAVGAGAAGAAGLHPQPTVPVSVPTKQLRSRPVGRRRVLAAVVAGLLMTVGVLALAVSGLTGGQPTDAVTTQKVIAQFKKTGKTPPPAPAPPAEEPRDDQGNGNGNGNGNGRDDDDGDDGGGNGNEGNGNQGRDD